MNKIFIEQAKERFLGTIHHVNPECKNSNFCLSHSEIGNVSYDWNKIESFTFSELLSAYTLGLEELRKKVKGMEKNLGDEARYGHPEIDMETGWNAALDEVLRLIEELDKPKTP